MEAKKNPKQDVQRRYSLHLSIGFMIALALVVTAFEWKTKYEIPIQPEDFETAIPIIDEVQITKIPEPPKPKVIMPVLVPVADEIEPEVIETIFDAEQADAEPVLEFTEPEDEPVDVPFVWVESMPEPLGGMDTFMSYLAKNIKYPKSGQRMGIQGRVFVQFIVDEEGNLTDIKVIKGINADFDSEAVRVLSQSPNKWKPGKQRGRPVKVRMVIPIIYKLH